MTSKKIFGYLVAFLAIAVLLTVNASAFGTIKSIEVNGIEALPEGSVDIASFAGQTIPVKIIFSAYDDAEDVRVKAWISGEKELTTVSERFDVIGGKTYSRGILVSVPNDLRDRLDEEFKLNVLVENRDDGTADEKSVDLTLQRESYAMDILDVDMESEVVAGKLLAIDVVLKNVGRHFAEDTFVRAKIEALKVEDKAFLGDLSPLNNYVVNEESVVIIDGFEFTIKAPREFEDEKDSIEGRLTLRIPSNAQPGVYVVEIEAFNDDSIITETRKVVVLGAEASSLVVSPVHSKFFNVGETAEYSITLVNSGDKVRLYELIVESADGLKIDVSDPVIGVPAGSSVNVKLKVTAEKAGTHSFAINVHSGAELIKRESFTADVKEVEDKKSNITGANPTVLLTVVLAIIFVVLLIVLIVLLTRRPERTEELGESYY